MSEMRWNSTSRATLKYIRSWQAPVGFEEPGGAAKGKGKSGGVRVIYFYRSMPDVIYILDIYPKSAKEDLTPADKDQLKDLVNRLKGVQ
jgi:RelE toxin of RelE / RelB toxin-antitoxin system